MPPKKNPGAEKWASHTCHCVCLARARAQDDLDAAYSGVAWSLAERYTDVCKTLCLASTFALVVPGGYFVAAGALAVTYAIDKVPPRPRGAPALIWERDRARASCHTSRQNILPETARACRGVIQGWRRFTATRRHRQRRC